jgi:hypothetical protein
MHPNKFIRPTSKTPQPAQPVAAAAAAETPRRLVEELSTETFEFPQPRGEQNMAPRPEGAIATRPNPLTENQPPPFIPPRRDETVVIGGQKRPSVSVKSHAETDPNFSSIDLPSLFQFYEFKQISCRTLKASHQAKFSRAHKEGKLRYVVEAISATLEPGLSAYDLSPLDFYFLMYWQRVNSFGKNPMVITAWCTNETHNEQVYQGYDADDPDNPGQTKHSKKDEETLRTEIIVNSTTLETKYATAVDLSEFSDLLSRYKLGAETMRDVVETTEMFQDEEEISEEIAFLLPYAAFLTTCEGQSNIKEKLKVVENMTPDDLADMDKYMKAVTDYGVTEQANVKCKECGSVTQVRIAFDPLTFLPNR